MPASRLAGHNADDDKRLSLRLRLQAARQAVADPGAAPLVSSPLPERPPEPVAAPKAPPQFLQLPAAKIDRRVACGILVETNMTYTPAPAVSQPYRASWQTRRASSLRRS